MALIIPEGYMHALFELQLAGDSEPMAVTCGFDTNGAESEPLVICNFLHETFGDNIMGGVGDEYQLTNVIGYFGQGGTEPPLVAVSTEPNVGGGNADDSLPQNTALLVRKRTDLAGRRGRGRLYLPGISRNVVSAVGVVSGSHVTAMQGFFDAWLSDLETGIALVPITPVILHRTEGAGTEPAPTPVVSFQVESTVATQRNRLRK